MEYIDLFTALKDLENYDADEIVIDEKTVLKNFSFESNYQSILPGGSINIDDDGYTLPEVEHLAKPDIIQDMVNKKDAQIIENIQFRYHMISPRNSSRANEIVLMFHGFNEKHWSKYLPWAKYIVDKTGKSVVLFPIAFHMNRAPAAWSNKKEMYWISRQRIQRHPDVINSSLSNVAISTRLHNKPKRFIWSGLQTYYDVIDLVKQIKSNNHAGIDPTASIDIFSYSIGSFLSEILMMTNQNGYFSDSKFISFCGGAVFNRLSPVSKYILDSEANVSLYSYVVEHLESHMKRDQLLQHYLGDSHPEGVNFRSMLNYKTLTKYREEKFRQMSNRIYAITLSEDSVVPAYEVINTLQGVKRDIPIRVDVLELSYKYKHEDPFPALQKIKKEVTAQFEKTFDLVCDFLT
ncbi:MAG: hypothetical protein RL662_1385 [Bacteroidota bacterium]|jgi:uncharacterized protein YfbU (UPF0304 family)